MNFFLWLDLGPAADYSALIIAEHSPTPRGPRYDVRHIERFRLGTSYPEVVAQTMRFLGTPPLTYNTPLVLDATGVGRPVAEMFDHLNSLVKVLITGGDKVTYEGGFCRVPKRDCVGAVQRLLQEERLKFADLPLTQTLVKELLQFKVRLTAAAHDTYGVWREGQHDDLVLALALAVWYAEVAKPAPPLAYLGKVRLKEGPEADPLAPYRQSIRLG